MSSIPSDYIDDLQKIAISAFKRLEQLSIRVLFGVQVIKGAYAQELQFKSDGKVYINDVEIGSGGVANHDELNNLTWSTAGHTMDANLNLDIHDIDNCSGLFFNITSMTGLHYIDCEYTTELGAFIKHRAEYLHRFFISTNEIMFMNSAGMNMLGYIDMNGNVIGDAGNITCTEINVQNNKIVNLLTPTLDTDASTKKYVDDNVGDFLADGSVPMTGDLDMGTKAITNVGLVDGKDVSTLTSNVGDFLADGSVPMTGNLSLGVNDIILDSGVLRLNDGTTTSGSIGFTTGVQNYIQRQLYSGTDYTLLNDQDYMHTWAILGTEKMHLSTTDGLKMYTGINMNGQSLSGLVDPTGGTDTLAATKKYVDDNAGTGDFLADGSVPLTDDLEFSNATPLISPNVSTNLLTIQGGSTTYETKISMFGAANVGSGDFYISVPNAAKNAHVSALYIDGVNDTPIVKVYHGLDVNSKKIINLATPTADTDASTKKYVDDNAGTTAAIFTLNNDAATGANVYLKVERGSTGGDARIVWSESDEHWEFDDSSVHVPIQCSKIYTNDGITFDSTTGAYSIKENDTDGNLEITIPSGELLVLKTG